MKGLVLTLLVFSMSSNADPMRPEAFNIKQVTQYINLMPVVGPEVRPLLTVVEADVISPGGCTDSDSFELEVSQVGRRQFVNIVRVKPDMCKAVSRKISVELSTQDAVLASQKEIHISNPLLVDVETVH